MPPILLTLMEAFRGFFTAPVFDHVLVLVTGAVLTPGKRTVSAVLRIMGLGQAGGFALYHHVLSQACWDSRAIARKLLAMILDRFLPAGPVIIGIDDTIERRWGQKIAARGIYRDPVRSSHGHFVKASGLRWLSFMAMIPLPLAQRRWALPFLTLLAPSQRHDDIKGKRHKSLVDWARQGILQIKRWLPGRLIIIVADSSFAAIELIAAVRRHVCFVTRLRLDANLFAPPPERRRGRGRPAKKGRKLRKLADILADPATVWTTIVMAAWYGGKRCRLEFTTGTAVWYHSGSPPVPIRWVLVRDPAPSRRPSCAPISMRRRPTFWDGTSIAGPWRRPSRRPASTSASSRRCADHAGAARPVLARHPVGRRSQNRCHPPSAIGRLVRQGRGDLQRRPRHGPPRAVGPAEFIDIPAKPGKRRNSRRPLGKTPRSRLLHDIKCAKSS